MTPRDLALRLLLKDAKSTIDPERCKRIQAAIDLLPFITLIRKGLWAAPSSRNKAYEVTTWHCPCPDNTYRSAQGLLCKHRTAVQALHKAEQALPHVTALDGLGIEL